MSSAVICSSTSVGTPDTEHGGLVDRLSGMPGLNPPPSKLAPPYAFFWVPSTARRVVTTGRQLTCEFQDTPLTVVRTGDAALGRGLVVRLDVGRGVVLAVVAAVRLA